MMNPPNAPPTGPIPSFPNGSIPPPPPPPPRNPQGQPPQWPNAQPAYGQPPSSAMNSAVPPPAYHNSQFAPVGAYGQVGGAAPTALPTDITDILGIAEKAASAVQALTNRQQQIGAVNPSMAQYGPPPTNSYSAPVYQHQEEKTVKITDLTPMIQYSLTNLKATGMLDKG